MCLHGAVMVTTSSCLRLLLVEDDATNRDVAVLMLSTLGYQADVAENGVEAVAAVQSAPYDMILMDIQMPEMDGMEASRRIRSELPEHLQPTIVAMTASITADYQELCRLAGMDHHLPKPVRIDALAAMLGSWSPRHDVQHLEAPQASDQPDATPQRASITPPLTADPSDEIPVWDPATLDALVADLGTEGRAVLEDLIGTFLDSESGRLATIAKAVDEDSPEALAFVAHALKSASAILGLLALSSAASNLEIAFQTATDSFDVVIEAKKLVAACDRATAALRSVAFG
jgi:CheY-like chemotaxis protein/HPt (histidine-containing phosphotransfer) domain-containing protein